jgi:mRNA-degrading endonuclease RelE of RelBE toxin-antitoxin system
MEVVVLTEKFKKTVKKLLNEKDLAGLVDYLQLDPEAGAIIPGTGGIRKLRWINPRNNKGKSGGLRILYYYAKGTLILLLSAYSKSNAENITEAQKNELSKNISSLLEKAMEDLQ